MLKKILLAFLSLFSFNLVYSQTNSVQYYIEEGIKKHDDGKFEEAIELYNNAIRLNPKNYDANYEKSLSLFAAKKYEESITLSKQILTVFKDNPGIKNVYSNYGSALDEAGKTKEALKVFDQGIEAFPTFYRLYFNKALTLHKMGLQDDALKSYQQALQISPFHSSSNNAISQLLYPKNKVPCLLATLTFLIAENQGERAQAALKRVEEIFGANVTKNEKGGVTISLSSDLFSQKKKAENDFSMVEISMSLLAGLDNEEAFKNENQAERLQRKLDMVIASLAENRKKNSGFFWDHYVPFFVEMKEKGFTEITAYLCYYSASANVVGNWLQENKEKVKNFYSWVQTYQWKNQVYK